jgi:hypothetical protein
MFWRIISRLARVVFVSFSQTTVSASRPPCEDEVELALAALGPEPAKEMKSRLPVASDIGRAHEILTTLHRVAGMSDGARCMIGPQLLQHFRLPCSEAACLRARRRYRDREGAA